MSCGILMLHRVEVRDRQRLPSNENMKVSPEFLSSYIKKAQHCGFTFLSLDEMIAYKVRSGSKKVLCMTLDDGYADNATNALEVFKTHSVPFAVYVATAFPEGTAHLWWYEMENILLNHESIEVEGHTFECPSLAAKDRLFLMLRSVLLNMPNKDFPDKYQQMFEPYLAESKRLTADENLSITWEQLQLLSKEFLCTIGGHTHKHSPLRMVSLEESEEDILTGNALLEQRLGIPITHFAYPFGTPAEADVREFDLVRGMNLRSAVTTRYGFVTQSTPVHALPRIMITENSVPSDVGPKKYYMWCAKKMLKQLCGKV